MPDETHAEEVKRLVEQGQLRPRIEQAEEVRVCARVDVKPRADVHAALNGQRG